jgi:hypothetical protein
MGYPAFNFGFEKGDEEWDYAYLTMDLMFAFFLLPEKANDPVGGVALWVTYQLQELAQAFLAGKASLNKNQSYLFLDGTDAIARMLLSGDERIKSEIFRAVKTKTSRFGKPDEFETYYLHHATHLLLQIRDFCSKNKAHLAFYERLFTRGKDHLTYAEWRKGLRVIQKS